MNAPSSQENLSSGTIATARWQAVRETLTQYIQREEAAFGASRNVPNTLMGHLERVAAHAVRLARAEGVDPFQAELAGLFHDAGKFRAGQYHEGDVPEEEHSIEVLRELWAKGCLEQSIITPVVTAIRQLYRDDPELTPLSKVLFDADNLDKLGLLGIANYFVKSGLRGQGITEDTIIRLTIELTYARYASRGLYTRTARTLAEKRSADTIKFIHDLLAALKEDGLLDASIERTNVADLELEYIAPVACRCGSGIQTRTWVEKGVKCTEIHLELSCPACGKSHKLRFCRPRLVG